MVWNLGKCISLSSMAILGIYVKFQVGSLSESTPKNEGKRCSHVIFVHPAICHCFNNFDHFTPDFITGVQQACDSDSSKLYPYTRNKNQWLETKK